ncbi:class I SAM-dependent methyltransferase [Acholeplasma hippikon]|uniref:Magnesium-protoporphyrin O-methyltransferase n=1 Tax=Acholeplasma hippikon TaxID=264636 RepID=A0A449BJE5_9MOLU|nr:class I SAM-dependent methyltransferase [Acholeplasma hippikon]VEU82586.1 Magnesium-protoporphyrin O-methyltransferase [Acholeplasma hippikon]
MGFEHLYDFLQEDVNFDELLKPLLPYIDKNEEVLDAGCGSGHILTNLASKGYRMVGVDINSHMLSLAKQRLEELNINADLYEHDLKKPLPRQFKTIIALLDVFHYFMGIKTIAKNMYNGLTPNGTLILDLYHSPVNEIETENDDYFMYTWKVETKGTKIRHDIKVYNGEFEGEYKVSQYYYPVSYYVDTLKEVGFKVSKINGFDDRKVYLICRK